MKKANQKRLLGDLAIEGGNFTTAQLKTQTIKDIFAVDKEAQKPDVEPENRKPDENSGESSGFPGEEAGSKPSKDSVGAFENAISAVEDVADKKVKVFNFLLWLRLLLLTAKLDKIEIARKSYFLLLDFVSLVQHLIYIFKCDVEII